MLARVQSRSFAQQRQSDLCLSPENCQLQPCSNADGNHVAMWHVTIVYVGRPDPTIAADPSSRDLKLL